MHYAKLILSFVYLDYLIAIIYIVSRDSDMPLTVVFKGFPGLLDQEQEPQPLFELVDSIGESMLQCLFACHLET